ncbi:MAG: alpha/beta hydrolase family protein, partial [Bacteroidota bacterium]
WIPILILLVASAAFAEVSISPAGKDFSIKAAQYEATVAADGAMPSLIIQGQEFFDKAVCRGAYLYDTTVMRVDNVTKVDETTVKAESDKATLLYLFTDDAIKLRMTNKEARSIELVMVYDLGVKALRDSTGKYYKPPLQRGWEKTTWFRPPARLTITGGTSIWGPWSGEHQVFRGIIDPGATREVTMEAAMATAEEQAKAKEIAERVVVPPTDPTGPMWDLKKFSQVPQVWPAEGFDSGDERIKAIYFAGPPYDGKPTKVFAWVGMPKDAQGKLPGMVLVHGGGGTAFASWVKLWVDRGYAAIAMDTCGALPRGSYSKWERNPEGGPPGWGGWGQLDDPREDQWTYHAVASALLSHTLLRAQPEVDPERIGVTGISWGGYLTSIIAGVDPRYKLAVPVYGCGFTLDGNFASSVMALGKERGERWMRWWDPSAYLAGAKMPMMWVTGTNDFAYCFPALQKSYMLPQGPRTLAIRMRMPHGHGPAGEGPEEIRVFADSILKGGDPLPKFTGSGRDGNTVWGTFESTVPIEKAELTFTKATGPWKERLWEALPARVEEGMVTAELPEGVTVYYLNLFDKRNCVVSTEHVELVK